MRDMNFVWPVRVYYEDTDAAGVVYYANYLKFMERARTEWLRALGVEQTDLLGNHEVVFVVHHVAAKYHQPARFNDALLIETHIQHLTPVRIKFAQRVMRDGVQLVSSEVAVVCVNAMTFKPVKIPQHIIDLLE